jgi:DNA-binding NarL/FixJ family response regulator
MLARRSVTPTFLRSASDLGGDLFTAGVPVSFVSRSRLWRESLVAVLAPLLDLRLESSFSGMMPPLSSPTNAHQRLIVLDGALPLESLIAWTRHWQVAAPPAPVVVLDIENRAESIRLLVRAGAAGYTVLGDGIAETVATIRQALTTKPARPDDQVRVMIERYGANSGVPSIDATALTPRELDILRFVAKDYSNKEIARSLGVEVCTVKHHIHNILRKLKTRHRWDAARLAAARGWLEEP